MFKYDGFRFIQKVINNSRHFINTSLIDGAFKSQRTKKRLSDKKPERRRNMIPGIATICTTTRSNDRDEWKDNAAANALCVITFVDKTGHTLRSRD